MNDKKSPHAVNGMCVTNFKDTVHLTRSIQLLLLLTLYSDQHCMCIVVNPAISLSFITIHMLTWKWQFLVVGMLLERNIVNSMY